VEDTTYYDGKIALTAIQKLNEMAGKNQPFFLGIGFLKPHLPFNAPQKYWDLYSEEEIQLAENPFLPKNAPDAAYHTFGELRAYADIPKEGPVPDSTAFKLVHGYYAATSYVDAQIGKVLDELKRLGLDKNTVVILLGDHGWQLGEHGLWCKHSPFDNALRTPVILRASQPVQAKKIDQLVEFIDIYPTLCELAGIDKPSHLDGDSWAPLLNGNTKSWKDAVYARYVEADAVVTSRYIYTEWHDKNGELYGKMMYDHKKDPEENENIVDDKKYARKYDELKQLLDNRMKDYLYNGKK
jgi:arylsulfatase A-like enzyme